MLSMAPKSRVRFAQYADRRLLYTRRDALSARTAELHAADNRRKANEFVFLII